MASKANVTFNILLISIAIIFGNVIRLRYIPISNDVKRSLGFPKESFLDFTELTRRFGYVSEEHTVVTDDGYILKLFRIVKGRNCQGRLKGPPVILMHGLLQGSDTWLDAGPNAGLAYLISDACWDLWVGNQRGNYYGRSHTRLNPDEDAAFWNFSVDEIGFYDIPATIDYVLKQTGVKKVNYIGYSQGAGTFFIMCSERPGYCEKANILIGLAPAARQTYTRSRLYRLLAETVRTMEPTLSLAGIHELFPKGAFSQEFLGVFCQLGNLPEGICGTGLALFDSFHPGSITNDTLRTLFQHFPAGTSVRNMARYGQSMKTDRFQKFDYGKTKNLELYGSAVPPNYNLSAVSVPVVALYGRNDHLVDTKDVEWLVQRLPNVLEVVEVKDPLWNHIDVTYSKYTSEMILPKVNEYLFKYSQT
ncbi:lipase 3-like [Epargyreus clarus]|uniref:lipase 3-like n=1 Tax=Epargyreus clarus TaxID=520877 RepID=UPI003C2EB847